MKSLTKVVKDLEEDLTEQQIEQLIYGANNKSIEEKDTTKEELVVSETQFIKIISRELNEDKKKWFWTEHDTKMMIFCFSINIQVCSLLQFRSRTLLSA